jgi:hypothetical protein
LLIKSVGAWSVSSGWTKWVRLSTGRGVGPFEEELSCELAARILLVLVE